MIQKVASALEGSLSRRHNSTVMLAVTEVKVETQVMPPSVGELEMNKGVPQGLVMEPFQFLSNPLFSL